MTRVWVDFLIAAIPSLSGSSVRATIATSAPEAANRVATAKPIPLLPPVTIAARPERLIFIAFSQTRAIARVALGVMADYLSVFPVSSTHHLVGTGFSFGSY